MLIEKAKSWKERLGRLELMTCEMEATPGAEWLADLSKDVALRIRQLHLALDKVIERGSNPDD